MLLLETYGGFHASYTTPVGNTFDYNFILEVSFSSQNNFNVGMALPKGAWSEEII